MKICVNCLCVTADIIGWGLFICTFTIDADNRDNYSGSSFHSVFMTEGENVTHPTNTHSSSLILSNSKYLKFKCSFCSKMFPRNWHLRNHMRIHTGIRPYVCQYCNKSFTQLGNLRRHLKIHTVS